MARNLKVAYLMKTLVCCLTIKTRFITAQKNQIMSISHTDKGMKSCVDILLLYSNKFWDIKYPSIVNVINFREGRLAKLQSFYEIFNI